jgi:serine/threonine-protein kinase
VDRNLGHEWIVTFAAKRPEPSVPLDLATICQKCLEKEAARRYATAQELADELGRFVNDEPIRARPANTAEKTWRWCRRKPALAASLSLAALLLMVVAIGAPIALLRIAAAREEAEQNLYVANMHQGIEALQSHDLCRARELLQRSESSPQQRAMRGWEWHYLKRHCRMDL